MVANYVVRVTPCKPRNVDKLSLHIIAVPKDRCGDICKQLCDVKFLKICS